MNIDDDQEITGMLNDLCEGDGTCSVEGGYCDKRLKRCLCKDGYVMKNLFKCEKASQLGESCLFDKQCQLKEPNSHCIPAHDDDYQLVYRCSCKANYNLELLNRTTKHCVKYVGEEHEYDELTAAPIILCFVGCVVVEIVCLIGFRYWKKNRMESIFRRGELNLRNLGRGSLDNSQSNPLPIVTFSIMQPPNPVISGACLQQAPPSPSFNTTFMTQNSNRPTCSGNPSFIGDTLPSYDEAVKLAVAVKDIEGLPEDTSELPEKRFLIPDK